MKKILILSDSHGKNDIFENVIKKEKPDFIIHCGDHCLDDEKYLNDHFDYFVRGNNDVIGKREIVESICGLKFLIIHGDEFDVYSNKPLSLARYASDLGVDVVLYGHSHIENFTKINNVILINPGSISLPRNSSSKKSYAIINIKDNKIIETNLKEIVRYI